MTQEEINKIEDEEAARWQERIEQTIRRAGLEPCDASGCDSGDPLDWTDTQVGHALNEQRDCIDELRAALGVMLDQTWSADDLDRFRELIAVKVSGSTEQP